MKRFALALVLVLAMVVPAFAQESLEIGTAKEGTLKDNVASYTFSASAQQVIVFNLKSDDFDPFLQVESADGDALVTDDDSGDGLYSRAIFVAPEAGEYNVVVRSYSGNATGAYVLNSTADVAQLAFEESVVVSLPEAASIQAFFIAEAGDVINLTATAADENVDTNLTLDSADGSRVDFSEDFNGINPALSRIVLPSTGMYIVTLAPYSTDDVGDVTLLLEKTTLPMLSADETVLTFTDDASREVVGFNTESGVLYSIVFKFDKETSGSVEFNGAVDQYSSYSYFSFSSVEGAAFLFRGKDTGLVRVKVTNNGYDVPVGYTVTVTPVTE